jgi:hypothetical protein
MALKKVGDNAAEIEAGASGRAVPTQGISLWTPGMAKGAPRLGPVTRRDFLSGLVLAGAAMGLAGCTTQNKGVSSAVGELPDGILPADAGSVGGPADVGYAPPVNFHMSAYRPPVRQPLRPVGALGIIPRVGWTTIGPNMRTIQPMNGVRLITFHHTGDPTPFYDDSYAGTARYWEAIRQWQRSQGFEDIGYHFGIDRVGRVWQLRKLEYRGEHVRDGFAPPHWLDRYVQWKNAPTRPIHGRWIWNAHNIGVVSVGNFMIQTPTPAQLHRIVHFGRVLRNLYQIPIYHCYTHQELVSTLCPGAHLQPYMEYIRRTNQL